MPNTKGLPTLYKRAETGAIIRWDIRAETFGQNHARIVIRWGQENGAIQETADVITEGKNHGKKNERGTFEQACSEAKSRWEKQQKARKYVQSREAALSGERDAAFVAGGIDPMLAFPAEKKPKAIKYPMYVQPKLDGHRCIAVIEDGVATLWSRTRKPILSAPHIVSALEAAYAGYQGTAILDGELYSHNFKENFEELTSLIRASEPRPGHEAIEYHIYDYPSCTDPTDNSPAPFHLRQHFLRWGVIDDFCSWDSPCLVLVETLEVNSEDEMLERFQSYLGQGYEGLMLRSRHGLYENKRSAHLLKVKEMMDSEFECVGVTEGSGSWAGIPVFEFALKDGKTFSARMVGKMDDLRKYVDDHSLAIGKKVTVKFQNLSSDGIPRFPVALRFHKSI